jgi:hypothetical protein
LRVRRSCAIHLADETAATGDDAHRSRFPATQPDIEGACAVGLGLTQQTLIRAIDGLTEKTDIVAPATRPSLTAPDNVAGPEFEEESEPHPATITINSNSGAEDPPQMATRFPATVSPPWNNH